MADAAPRFLYPPIPPWRVRLMGAGNDLQDLANEHSQGRTRVLRLQKLYHLESDLLNSLSDPKQVYKRATEILQLISGLARIRRFAASPVKPIAVLWTDGNGHWVRQILFASEQVDVVPSTEYLKGPNISERCLELAATNEVVRLNLLDFLGERDFPRLRRIVRVILLDLGGNIKNGVDEVVRVGWATRSECARFDESVNFGDKNQHGAHSRLELVPGQNQNPMNGIEAAEFVRGLFAQWVASKI